MGYEHRIRFEGQSAATLDAVLRAAPHFARYLSEFCLYEYHSASNADVKSMPDAYATVEPEGFYFCDNGGSSVAVAVLTYLQGQVEATGQTFGLQEL